jgi:tetratricopeptide (TPR) repeat protein
MTQTNLRFYNRYIQSLLEKDNASAAADHCRHILMSFPKHIKTYRLYGEASLELNRYPEAFEIFRRLLSSVPDDYVAHIGMSVVSEELGKPDSAIWHMSRAYELQPYNVTIQNELRRLTSQRDGLEIQKLSLTRPALARMYARGGLNPQAIAEITTILIDQPERYDLLILLANLRYQTGAIQEAASLAHTILEKLPYCLEAISLLIKILPYGSLTYDLSTILQKYHDLDPYTRYLDETRGDVTQVPDNKVALDWLARYPEPETLLAANEGTPDTDKIQVAQNAWMYEDGEVTSSDEIIPSKDTQSDDIDGWVSDDREILQ